MIFPVKRLADLGFRIFATSGTADVLRRNGIPATVVRKISERDGRRPGERTIVDLILDGEIAMVVNTPSGQAARADGYEIRAATTALDKPIITTVQELAAAVQGIEAPAHRRAAGRVAAGARPRPRPLRRARRGGGPGGGCARPGVSTRPARGSRRCRRAHR